MANTKPSSNHPQHVIDPLEDTFQLLMQDLDAHYDGIFDSEQYDNTPARLTKMYKELLEGYNLSPTHILSKRFQAVNNDMIIVKDIPFVSLCAHHWLPFIGTCSVGYIPNNKEIVGLSKIPRLVNCFARRFQVQENMTNEIATSLFEILRPQGCIVITKAKHMCAEIRGVQSKNSEMIVSALRGDFEQADIRNEFYNLINR